MATTIEDLKDLELKLSEYQVERDKLYKSLNDNNQPGGSWYNAVKNECGAVYNPSKTCMDLAYYPVQKSGCCPTVKLVKDREARISFLDSQIPVLKAKIEALKKDPTVIQDLKDQEANRKLRNNIIIVVVIVIILIIAFFLYRKYKK